jgi:beta-lactamase superfamily II metal-dependent hydrolase
MAKRKQRRRAGRNFIVVILVGLLAAFFILSSVQDKYDIDLGIPEIPAVSFHWQEAVDAFLNLDYGAETETLSPQTEELDGLKVHFIDVGQAKSILVQAEDANILIDAGENDQGELVLSYLRRQGVQKLDLLIGTHPNSDHIGGMDTVIQELDIGGIIMPEIPGEIVPTTKTYTDVLLAIARRGYQITPATPGDAYGLGGAELTILAPAGEYGDLNNLSVASRLTYGGVSFLFTGDMEAEAEGDVAAAGRNLRCDVLDVSHHGSNTSTTGELLDAAAPAYAVVSCGLDNSYGHPHREVVERVRERDIRILRTDLNGNITLISDGESIGVEVEKNGQG